MIMRKFAIVVLVLAFCSSGWAQRMSRDNGAGEIYLGYSLLNGSTLSKASGFEAALVGNANEWLGWKADFSGNYRSAGPAHAHELDMLFGPQVSDHIDRLNLFAHGLVGVAHFGGNVGSDTGLGWVLGGGADYNLSPNLSARFAQLDYHGAHVFGTTQKDFRFSAGLIVHF
jgi:opacity protein-like surface antigen